MLAAYDCMLLLAMGVLTGGSFALCVAPDGLVRSVFGEALTPATRLITRHWGVLLGLTGLALVLAAFHPELRRPVLVFAVVEKLAIGGLVLASPLRRRAIPALIAGIDALMALTCIAIFVGI